MAFRYIFVDFVIFPQFWSIVLRKIWQPWCLATGVGTYLGSCHARKKCNCFQGRSNVLQKGKIWSAIR
jgi:hypothetical protein